MPSRGVPWSALAGALQPGPRSRNAVTPKVRAAGQGPVRLSPGPHESAQRHDQTTHSKRLARALTAPRRRDVLCLHFLKHCSGISN